MSRASLTDLLEALGELFLLPGAFAAPCFESGLNAQWAPGSLREPLQRLLAAPRAGLDILYAEHFLHGFERPTVHLQASAHRTGLLLDPGLMAELSGIYAEAGIEPVDAVHPDHLGAMTLLLSVLLKQMPVAEETRADALESAARILVDSHLAPLLVQVKAGLSPSRPDDPYRAAVDALESCLGICARVLV